MDRCARPTRIGQIVAADFFVVPTAIYRLLFVLVLLAHDRRRIRHVAVTAHPTAAWTAQQLREVELLDTTTCARSQKLRPATFFCGRQVTWTGL